MSSQQQRLARFFADRTPLIALALATLLITLLLMGNGLLGLLGITSATNMALDPFLDEQETIAILLIGFGVALEGREVFTRKFADAYTPAQHERMEAENLTYDYYGVLLLLVGLVIEIFLQFIHILDTYVHLSFIFGLAVISMAPLNVLAVLLLVVILRILYADATAAPSP